PPVGSPVPDLRGSAKVCRIRARTGRIDTVAVPADPTATAFLLAESRRMPMHVGGLELFRPPPDAGPDAARALYESLLRADEIAPLFLRRPHRSPATGGHFVWQSDPHFDIEYHVRHSALPRPERVL